MNPGLLKFFQNLRFSGLVLVILPVLLSNSIGINAVVTAAQGCATNPCKNGASCKEREIPTSIYWEPQNRRPYECQCLYGWEGVNCTENVDDCKGNPCLNGGTCEDRSNAQYVCHCSSDFIGRKCEHVDPCLKSPCQHGGRCESSLLGDYQCVCPRWYEGTNCEKLKHPCKPHSQCRNGTSSCETLYEFFEVVKHKQQSSDDLTHLAYRRPLKESRISGFRCTCKPGFAGALCEREIDGCQGHACQNGARCVNKLSHYECICSPGFRGAYCNIKEVSELTLDIKPELALSVANQNRGGVDANKDDRCNLMGCTNKTISSGVCSGLCIQAGCSNEAHIASCSAWIGCLEATKFTFPSGQPSCVERYRNGVCDTECDIPACFYDGFDCSLTGSRCPADEQCRAGYADGVCQSECNSAICGFDGGDCLTQPPTHVYNKDLPSPSSPSPSPGYLSIILSANRTAYAREERPILARLASLLQSIVRVATDENDQPLVVDVDGGRSIRVTLTIDLLNTSSGIEKGENEAFQTVEAAAQSLTAALETKTIDLPLPVAQLWAAKDFNEVLPNHVTPGPPGGLPFLKSQDAMGLYICLCTLSGAVIVLLIFVVIQRRPWKEAAKRVRTRGIWFPPSFHFSQTDPSMRVGVSQNDNSAASKRLLPPVTSQMRTEGKMQVNNTESHLEDLLHPTAKRVHYSPNAVNMNAVKVYDESQSPASRVSYGSSPVKNFAIAPMSSTDVYHYQQQHIPISSNQQQFKTDSTDEIPVAAVTAALNATIRSSDGLHPLSPDAVAKIDMIVRNKQSYNQQLGLKRSFSAIESSNVPPEFDVDGRVFLPGRNLPAEKLQHQECFLTNRNPVNGETVLHLAARMNVGARAIRRLCGSLVSVDGSSEKTLSLLCLDKDGRSPLAASAATDGIETTTALYRLEREAITSSRTTHPATSEASTSVEKTSVENRRRARHIESRRSTPLMVSLKSGCTEVTKLLLDEGCSIQGVDETGRNLAHWAAVLNAASLLTRISHTKGFTRMLEARDDCDRTPLMLAVRENSVEAAKILLDHQASIDVYDYTDSCPINEAKLRGLSHMLGLLMEYKHKRSPSGSNQPAACLPSKERRGSESSSSSTTSEEGTGSEFGARASTDTTFQSPSQQYASYPQISPEEGTISTSNTEASKWQDKVHIKPDPSVKSEYDEHISPESWHSAALDPRTTQDLSPTYWHQAQISYPCTLHDNYNYTRSNSIPENNHSFPVPYTSSAVDSYAQLQDVQQYLSNGRPCYQMTTTATPLYPAAAAAAHSEIKSMNRKFATNCLPAVTPVHSSTNFLSPISGTTTASKSIINNNHIVSSRSNRNYISHPEHVDIRGGQSARGMFVVQL